jgi:hypothetical protein
MTKNNKTHGFLYEIRQNIFFRAAFFLSLLIFTYFCLVSITPLLPKGRLDDSLREASDLFLNEGTYPVPYSLMPSFATMDNYSDAILLNIIGTLNPKEPISSGMNMSFSRMSLDVPLEPLIELKNLVDGKTTVRVPNHRYWHGSVVILRPLLSVMSLNYLRKTSFFLLTLLLSITLLLLHHRTDWVTTLGFVMSMAFGGFPFLAFIIYDIWPFWIALGTMCAVLFWNGQGRDRLILLFLLSGSLNGFIEPLTAPMITFLMPLLTLIILDLRYKSFCCDWNYIKKNLLLGFSWVSGYLLTWGAKWVLASILLRENVLRDAFQKIFYRAGIAEEFTLLDRFIAIAKNIRTILPFSIFPSVALIVLMYIVLLVPTFSTGLKRRHLGARGYLLFAILFLIPYFWFFFTANHATIHDWFTYRNQISSVWLFFVLPHLICPYDKLFMSDSRPLDKF